MASKRIPLVAGNWKMNFDHLEATYFVQKLVWLLRDAHFDFKRCEVALFPSFTSLRSVQVLVEADKLHVAYGAQSVSVTTQGAFTGDVSADMIAHLGCSYVIVGHSELDFAVGQVRDVTRDLNEEQAAKLIVAYEPVWAIGTGMVATPQSAQDAANAIRNDLKTTFGTKVSDSVRILYGGSVTSKNAAELISQPDVDGFLIGGAALDVEELAKIARLALKSTKSRN